MNLSLSVLATILFLAPGIAGFLGAMLGARTRSVRPSMPTANSLSALVAIVLIAVAAHGLVSLGLIAQRAYCHGHGCIALRFDPNIYGQILEAAREPVSDHAPSDLIVALGALMLLCVVTGVVARVAVAWDMRRGVRSSAAPILYGWLAALDVDATRESSVVIAHVLTKMRGDELAIGYRGMVEEVSLTADKEIASITLVGADRFGLPLRSPTVGQEHTVLLAELLPRVYIPGREIENVVLNVVPLGPSG